MNYNPKDIVAIGLLLFIFLYIIIIALLIHSGNTITDSGGIRAKEIVIYIVGVLSGYIGGNHVGKLD